MPQPPIYNRLHCVACGGSGKDHKKRKKPCPYCRGSGKGDRCADCKKLIGSSHPDARCKCQDLPFPEWMY